MKNISKFILTFFIAVPLVFAFGTQTVKQIDEIKNNTGTDIVLNPTDKVKINYFTGQKALQSTVDGELEESAVTNTELGYVSGVTSGIQGQLDSKTPLTRLINTTAPLQGGGDLTTDRTLSILQSGTAQDGYLSQTDWNTFNDKQDALTFGDLTESTSSVLTITGGTGAVIGSGASINVQQSSTTSDGYLSSVDWNTFNNKQSALTGTNGDLYYYNSGLSNLAIGTTGQVLQVSALGFPEWADLVAVSVTTKGDLQTYSTAPDRLPVGTNGQVLSANSATTTGLEWIDPNFYSSPLTTDGDLLYYSSGETRLAAGTEGQLLTMTSGFPSWQDAPVTLPSQTGNEGLYLTTDGSNASWNEINEDTNEIKNNFLECSGFDGCTQEGTITNGAGVDASSIVARTTETTAFNPSKLNLSQSLAGTLDYTYTKTANYDSKQLVAYCEIKTSNTQVTFSAGADGVEAGSLDVSSDNSWKYYKIPFVGGATTQYFKVDHVNAGETPNIDIDNCFIGKSPDTVKEIYTIETQSFLANGGSSSSAGRVTNYTIQEESGGGLFTVSNGIWTAQKDNTQVTVTASGAITLQDSRMSVYFTIGGNFYLAGQDSFDTSAGYRSSASATYVMNAGDSFEIRAEGQGSIVNIDVTMSAIYTPDTTNTVVTQETELTAKTANTLSASYNSGGFLIDQNYNWTSTCTHTNGTGDYSCSIDPSVGLTNSCDLQVTTATDGVWGAVTSRTTTSFTVRTRRHDNTVIDSEFSVACIKTGADVNKSQTIVGKFENINSSDLVQVVYEQTQSYSGVSSPVSLNYQNKIIDTYNAYNTSTGVFTVPTGKSGIYTIDAGTQSGFTGVASMIYVTVNGSTVRWYPEDGFDNHQITLTVSLNEDDTVQAFVGSWSGTGTHNSVTNTDRRRHRLSIKQMPDYEAIVKNLSDQKEECTVHDLTANTTSTGILTDLNFNNLEVGKKYRAFLRATMYESTPTSNNKVGLILMNHNSQTIGQVYRYTVGTNERVDLTTEVDFVAEATTLTFDYNQGVNNNLIGSGGLAVNKQRYTFAKLCELPDSTIINSTKFD